MSSQGARCLSAGTGGGGGFGWSGEAGRRWGPGSASQQPLLHGCGEDSRASECLAAACCCGGLGERRPPAERRTKYRPPINMDLKSYSLHKGAH